MLSLHNNMKEIDVMKVGDDVQWMQVSSGRNTYSFTTKYGKIYAIEGNVATVRTRRGAKDIHVALSSLRTLNERSPVGDVVDALAWKKTDEEIG